MNDTPPVLSPIQYRFTTLKNNVVKYIQEHIQNARCAVRLIEELNKLNVGKSRKESNGQCTGVNNKSSGHLVRTAGNNDRPKHEKNACASL